MNYMLCQAMFVESMSLSACWTQEHSVCFPFVSSWLRRKCRRSFLIGRLLFKKSAMAVVYMFVAVYFRVANKYDVERPETCHDPQVNITDDSAHLLACIHNKLKLRCLNLIFVTHNLKSTILDEGIIFVFLKTGLSNYK